MKKVLSFATALSLAGAAFGTSLACLFTGNSHAQFSKNDTLKPLYHRKAPPTHVNLSQRVDLNSIIKTTLLGYIPMAGFVPTAKELLQAIKAKNPAAVNLTTNDFDFEKGSPSATNATIVGKGDYFNKVWVVYRKQKHDLSSLPNNYRVSLPKNDINVTKFKDILFEQFKQAAGFSLLTKSDIKILRNDGQQLSGHDLSQAGILKILVKSNPQSILVFGQKTISVKLILWISQTKLINAKQDLSSLPSAPISLTLNNNFNRVLLFKNTVLTELKKAYGFSALTLSDLVFKNAQGNDLSPGDVYQHTFNLGLIASPASAKFTGQKSILVTINFRLNINSEVFKYENLEGWMHHAGYMTEYTSGVQTLWNFQDAGINSWTELLSLLSPAAAIHFNPNLVAMEKVTYCGFWWWAHLNFPFTIPDISLTKVRDHNTTGNYNLASAVWINANVPDLTIYHYLYVWQDNHAIYYTYQWGATTAFFLSAWNYEMSVSVQGNEIY